MLTIPMPAHSFRRAALLAGATACLLAITSAQAEVTVTMTDRWALNYVLFEGGYEYDLGAGNPNPTVGLWPPVLGLAGNYSSSGFNWPYDWAYGVSWNQSQSWALTGSPAGTSTLSAAGIAHIDGTSQACHIILGECHEGRYLIDSFNTQNLFFTLSGDTTVQFAGHIEGGETLLLMRWTESAGEYLTINNVTGPRTGYDFDRALSLTAGRYQVRNRQTGIRADSAPAVQHAAWNYTLTFDNAVAVVPEPASALLMGLGLGAALLRRRAATRIR
jgi:hypothetical protein